MTKLFATLVSFFLLPLFSSDAIAQYRPVLTGDTVFYYKTTGNDVGNDCRNAAAPCKTCSAAAKSASRIDTMGYNVTIQHLDEGAPVVINVNCFIGTMTGGGNFNIVGSPMIGNTILDAHDPATGAGVDDITLFDTHVSVFIDQMTLRGGGSGMVSVDYNSRLTYGSYTYWGEGRVNAQGRHDNSAIYVHDSMAQVLAFNYPKIIGSMSAFMTVNGSQVFVEGGAMTFQNSPTFDCVFNIMNNGSMQHITVFYSGLISGNAYCLANGGALNTYESPISITGASPGVNNGGHYQP